MKKALILLITSLTLVATGCSSNSSNEDTTTKQTQTTEKAIVTTEETTVEETTIEETTTPNPTLYKIGDSVTIGDWDVTVNSFEITDSIPSGEYFKSVADKGSQFVVANITIKNTGTKAGTFIPSYSFGNSDVVAKIIYQDAYEFNGTYLLSNNDDLHDEQLNPLESKTGILAFSVAQEAIDSSDSMILRFILGKEAFEFDAR